MNNFLKVLLVIDLVAVNMGVGYAVYKAMSGSDEAAPTSLSVPIVAEGCGETCMTEISRRIAAQTENGTPVSVYPTITLAPTAKPVGQAVTYKKVRREEILTIPGSGATSANDWSDLGGTEFYFDTRDYPGLIELYFEANMKLVNGNGLAYVRLFDITNGIGVNGSENNTANQADTWTKSQKVNFWAGRNLIRVQGRSLTADTSTFNTGRLRIITEN